MTEIDTLLEPDEPAPTIVERPFGASPIILNCDHAGNRIPRRLGRLGLPESELERHIAFDIGALGVARELSQRLDATLLAQPYSRLVIDCNRRTSAKDSVPPVSELTEIPGNLDLPNESLAARRDAILVPYQRAIADALNRRLAAGAATAMVSVHSFTPVYKGQERPWHLGVIHGRDGRGHAAFLAALGDVDDLNIGVDQPYTVDMDVDFTLPIHAEGCGVAYVELEIRQDMIGTPQGQRDWGVRLAPVLERWLAHLQASGDLAPPMRPSAPDYDAGVRLR